ncbi:hypothetical protein CHS0354_018386 [Potamilus streckersoni]|uniref:Cytochrome c domain-containing protein n=1 Tax=Potamilus streckersoni TaxID=2493646 RepID=A0AAE0TAA6_9BIVA|nr:hypothetical protein CHS0354_018386 [Potamilus streckersoni]
MFKFIETHPFSIAAAIFSVIIIGGLVEVWPAFTQNTRPMEGLKPYSALELAGRQIYIREGCNNCHSQLIRPFKNETDRYGAYSKSGEYAYDRPFLWGSRRIGPDLFRVGAVRTTDWHEAHFRDAQSTSPGSVMPNFTWFFEDNTDIDTAYAELITLKQVFNLPYDSEGMPKTGTYDEVKKAMLDEAALITADMKSADIKTSLEQGNIKEVVAMIAYLNRLK